MFRVDRARRRSVDGFVLIEALVALAILGATLVLVNRTLAAGWTLQHRVDLEVQARGVARAVLTEMGATSPLRSGVTTGVEQGINWRVEVSPYDAGGASAVRPRIPAWWVVVVVRWQDASSGKEKSLELTTLKLGMGTP